MSSNTTLPSDSYRPLLPPECQLDDSRLIFGSKIGEGSVGEIQSGLYQGVPVAIKTLKKEFEAGSPQWNDFLREATISAGLRHKNIVSTLGITDSEPPVMVQELMEGGSVEDFLLMKQKQKGCPWQPDREQLLGWCKDLARSLCYLHEQDAQILHRDIKPANVSLVFAHPWIDPLPSIFSLCQLLSVF